MKVTRTEDENNIASELRFEIDGPLTLSSLTEIQQFAHNVYMNTPTPYNVRIVIVEADAEHDSEPELDDL